MATEDPPDPDSSDPLARAAETLADPSPAVPAAALDDALGAVRRYLARRFPSLSREDLEDVTSEATIRLLRAAQLGQIEPGRNPTGYLLRIAHNAAVDQVRRGRPETPLPAETLTETAPATDDELAAHLDQDATADRIRRAMTLAVRQDDMTAVRVATHFLDVIHRTGSAPSHRQAADALGVSHTGVAKALVRLRSYIRAGDDPAEAAGQSRTGR